MAARTFRIKYLLNSDTPNESIWTNSTRMRWYWTLFNTRARTHTRRPAIVSNPLSSKRMDCPAFYSHDTQWRSFQFIMLSCIIQYFNHMRINCAFVSHSPLCQTNSLAHFVWWMILIDEIAAKQKIICISNAAIRSSPKTRMQKQPKHVLKWLLYHFYCSIDPKRRTHMRIEHTNEQRHNAQTMPSCFVRCND